MPQQSGFDPSKPFKVVGTFDPSQPFQEVASGEPKPAAPKSWLDHAFDAVKGTWENANPITPMKAMGETVIGLATAPKETTRAVVGGYGQQTEQIAREAEEAFKKGDYTTGAIKTFYWLLNGIPGIGSSLNDAANEFSRGEYGKGFGHSVGTGIAVSAPAALQQRAALKQTTAATTPPAPPNPRADLRQFAAQQDIPLDAATASGNRFVQGIQRVADESAGGSIVGERAQAAQHEALNRTARRLADQAGPAVTADQAGEAIHAGMRATIDRYAQEAAAAYALADTPSAQRVPVNLAPVKKNLAQLYQALMREKEVVGVLQGGKARALTALDRLMHGPDQVSIATADAATGDLGVLAGSADVTRTPGQAAAAQAFAKLRQSVDNAALQAGPDVLKALQEGRKATKAKWVVNDALEALNAEPVRAFNQSTARSDAALRQLEAVRQYAPKALPQLARAWIDQISEKLHLTGLDPLARAQGVLREWEALGAKTKAILFPDPAHLKDLDRFFRLNAEIAKNPNPSGTALTGLKFGEVFEWGRNPAFGVPASLGLTSLSAFLHSRAGARLLSEGLMIPARSTAAANLWLRRAQAFAAKASQMNPVMRGAAPPTTAPAQ